MVRSRQTVVKQGIVPSEDAALLRQACPDLDHWPMRWRYEDADLSPGNAIVAVFKPFLIDMLRSKPSRTIFNRHRDNLWQVGGEFIRLRHDRTDLRRMRVERLIHILVDEDGGPLIWPRISESEQNAIDATCRNLYRFLNRSTSTE